jgi:hypothetical protein
MNRDPSLVVAPLSKIDIHRLPGRKIAEEVAPLTALRHDVKDGVEDCPHADLPRTSAGFSGRNEGRD